MHICVSKLTIIGSDNGLSPGRRLAIIWTNAGIMVIGPLGTNFNEIFFKIQQFSFQKMRLKMLSGMWRPFCLCLSTLTWGLQHTYTAVTHPYDHKICLITMMSQWARWRLKSPASRLFAQPFIRVQIKENIKAPRHWPLCGEFTGDRVIPRSGGQ